MSDLSDQTLKNIETIINLQAQRKQDASIHQRILERIAAGLGKPWFLYVELAFFATWVIYSHLANINLINWELPRFDVRAEGVNVISLLISTGVLIYQTRQEELSDERSHLILQLNLITEQKITKIIALVEELRIDLPNVRDRDDQEAELMQETADPQVVLDLLHETLEQTAVESN
jgi:uncharacterized membrane protein